MNLNLFKDDPLYSEALRYWINTWHAISHEVENGTLGIEIVNIRIVLSDIVNEYTLNKFDSNNNRKVYIKLIESFLKEKHIVSYRNDLIFLKDKLEAKDNESIYIIAEKLSEKISTENFSKVLFEELLIIIKSKSFKKTNRIKITELTKAIIIDLVTSGRQIEDIKRYLEDVFETYFIHEEEIITSFKYLPEDLSKEEIIKIIDDLTIEDRLKIFKKNLSPEEHIYHFVFPVWGITAPIFEINEGKFLDFHLYDPTVDKSIIPDEIDDKFSYKTRSTITGKNEIINSRCNAYIKVHATSDKMAIKNARQKHSTLISLLNYNFGSKDKLIFADGQYFGKIINKNHGLLGNNLNLNKQDTSKRIIIDNPINLTSEKLKQIKEYSIVIETLKEKELFRELNTVLSVLELMAKSIQESEENKLLNYWICIESLASISKKHKENTFGFIKEVLSNMYFYWEQFLPIHRLFDSLKFHISYTNNHGLPNEFIDFTRLNINLSEDDSVSLIPFYTRLNELPFNIKDVHLIDIIDDTLEFYKNNNFALIQLRNKKKETLLIIDYIYKTRNQIVHNGYIDKNLIPYLVKFVEGYSKSLFQTIINVYLNNNFDLQTYFIKQKENQKILENKLSNDDFHEIKFI